MSVRRPVARAFFGISGWRLVTERIPQDGRGVVIGGPHTSNWDFFLMLAIAWEGGLRFRWLGKRELFRGPFAPLLRALGGIAVDRAHPVGLVEGLLARLRAGESFYLVVTPEGTRRGSGWKSGFYRIARGAGLPVTLGYVDRTTKTVGLGPTLEMTGDVRADMDRIRAFYADKSGWVPSRRTEPRLREESAGTLPRWEDADARRHDRSSAPRPDVLGDGVLGNALSGDGVRGDGGDGVRGEALHGDAAAPGDAALDETPPNAP